MPQVNFFLLSFRCFCCSWRSRCPIFFISSALIQGRSSLSAPQHHSLQIFLINAADGISLAEVVGADLRLGWRPCDRYLLRLARCLLHRLLSGQRLSLLTRFTHRALFFIRRFFQRSAEVSFLLVGCPCVLSGSDRHFLHFFFLCVHTCLRAFTCTCFIRFFRRRFQLCGPSVADCGIVLVTGRVLSAFSEFTAMCCWTAPTACGTVPVGCGTTPVSCGTAPVGCRIVPADWF